MQDVYKSFWSISSILRRESCAQTLIPHWYIQESGLDISMGKPASKEHKTTDDPQNMAHSQEKLKVNPVLTPLIEILCVTLYKKKSHDFLIFPRIISLVA